MEKYFNIKYEFNKDNVEKSIDQILSQDCHGYIPVVDGVVLSHAQKDANYRNILSNSMFAICDSSWVPLYIRMIYGVSRSQYCGAMIFKDLVEKRSPLDCEQSKYRMAFLGTNTTILNALKDNLAQTMNPNVKDMLFYELPFCKVEEFDYKSIAKMLDDYRADLVWVALGAPKQEIFMSKLDIYLNRGIQIAVGAVFKFYSGLEEKRAPKWMSEMHLEFLFRIFQSPQKQLKRCFFIALSLPKMIFEEVKRKKRSVSFKSECN